MLLPMYVFYKVICRYYCKQLNMMTCTLDGKINTLGCLIFTERKKYETS